MLSNTDAKTIKNEISRAQKGFTRQSATVLSYRPYSGRGGIATVQPDGPGAEPMEATNTTGTNLNPNDRVMLDFDPPAGVYVLGLVTSQPSGACDPMAVRCHVSLTCAGLEYTPLSAAGDYEIGGTSVSASLGLVLPAAGVWHIGFNVHGNLSTGSYMGQGLFTVTHSDTNSFDYGVAVGNDDDTVNNHVSGSGAVDHMVPAGETATVKIVALGSGGLQFMSVFSGILYAHRIECTEDLATVYP